MSRIILVNKVFYSWDRFCSIAGDDWESFVESKEPRRMNDCLCMKAGTTDVTVVTFTDKPSKPIHMVRSLQIDALPQIDYPGAMHEVLAKVEIESYAESNRKWEKQEKVTKGNNRANNRKWRTKQGAGRQAERIASKVDWEKRQKKNKNG